MKPQTINVSKRTGIGICVASLVLVVLIVLRRDAPPLRIVGTGTKLTADVSTLGEYPTTVTKIRLSDAESNAVVWEVSSDGVAQLHRVNLVVGQNPAQIAADYGSYRVVSPSSSGSFLLRESKEYRIEIWGASGVLTKKSASFHFGN